MRKEPPAGLWVCVRVGVSGGWGMGGGGGKGGREGEGGGRKTYRSMNFPGAGGNWLHYIPPFE